MLNKNYSRERKKARGVTIKRPKGRKTLPSKSIKVAPDKEVSEWIFSDPLYPVEYGGDSKEDVVENYPKYLREFLKHRLKDQLDPLVEKSRKGHGGKRVGAERPKGIRKPLSITIGMDADMGAWIQRHKNDIRSLMVGDLKLVACKH